jgi:hypothetical protein
MAGKIEVPDSLKTDLPPTTFGKILAATPVVMAVISTMLAGLASSEMTRAQYDRSSGAQLQSKAGDQWNYAADKKNRGALAHNSLDLLAANVATHPLTSAALPGADDATIAALTEGKLPAVIMPKYDDGVKAALDALASNRPEPEITAALTKVKESQVAAALSAASDAANDFDSATKSINSTSDKLDGKLMHGAPEGFRDFAAARLAYTAARYDAEARLNQAVASVYELQVREKNISAEKHHARSANFFYGMLASQMGVIIATFALAARKRNLLWSLAAAAGAAAVAFSVYVYLCV